MNFNTLEISKLIQFAFELHQDELDYVAKGTYYVPNFKYADDNCFPNRYSMKRVEKGAVFGSRQYPNHSDNTMWTVLGVITGEHLEKGFKYSSAIMFQTNHVFKNPTIYVSELKPDLETRPMKNFPIIDDYAPNLIYDSGNYWEDKDDDYKLSIFLRAMETVGFKKEDVLAVLNGEKTAEQAYTAVAPQKIVYRRYVFLYRTTFVFEGNTMVRGNLDIDNLDSFPFPFEGSALIDCSKVHTACGKFGENIKGHKLINVNSNPDSIRYTDLRNIIIEEVIDLSIVNATWTKFGHHTVINLDKSITPLEEMNLMFAVDEKGNRFAVDRKGVVKLDELGKPRTLDSNPIIESNGIESNNNGDPVFGIEVMANADDAITTKHSIENGADGIGLIRTEHMYFDDKGKPIFIDLFTYEGDYDKTLKQCAEIQRIKANEIYKNLIGKDAIFRLLDAKLNEFLLNINSVRYNWHFKNFDSMRGAKLLVEFPDIVKMQVKAIIEAAIENNAKANFLVPMITDTSQLAEIRAIIQEVAEACGFDNYFVGAMIENVKMANEADWLADDADFISFGTNDLTESVTGLSRNSDTEDFYTLNDMIRSVIKEGIYRSRAVNPYIRIGICGEHVNHAENFEFLREFDIDYISCNADFIPTAKKIIASNEKYTEKIKRNGKH